MIVQNMRYENTRVKWIDLSRAVAIFLVVLCHATGSIFKLNYDDSNLISIAKSIFGFVCFTAGRLGVPLFLMITGSLLLNKNFDDSKSIKIFWTKKWLNLLLCTWFWFVVYDIFLLFYCQDSISFMQVAEELFFFRVVNMGHVWYMPTILGMYILLPFVSKVLRIYDNKLFVFPMIIFTFYCFGFTSLNSIYRLYFPDLPMTNFFSSGFSGGCYGLLILYGYFVNKGALKNFSSAFIFLTSLFSFFAVIFIQVKSIKYGIEYFVWYNDLFLLLASVGIFELLSRVRIVYGYKIIRGIAVYAFGVYLIHNIFRTILEEAIIALHMIAPIKLLILCILCFGASFLSCLIISRIPKIGRFLLYMKS